MRKYLFIAIALSLTAVPDLAAARSGGSGGSHGASPNSPSNLTVTKKSDKASAKLSTDATVKKSAAGKAAATGQASGKRIHKPIMMH